MGEKVKIDDSLEQKFRDKNNKILIDNILRQIDDNDNSLRLTLFNKISLITSEILKKINIALKDTTCEYDFKDISSVFSKYESVLKKSVFSFLDKRKDDVTNNSIVNDEFVQETFIHILETFISNNKKDFEKEINVIVYADLENALFSVIKFSTEEQKNLVVSYLKRYDFKLTAMVEESVEERNRSLKNLVLETHEKVETLNTQTAEISNSLVKNKAA